MIVTITSFSFTRGLPTEEMAIGNIGTRHSLRSACSLPHGSRTPARGGYGNIPRPRPKPVLYTSPSDIR